MKDPTVKSQITEIIENRLKKDSFKPNFINNIEYTIKNNISEIIIHFTIMPIYFPLEDLLGYLYNSLYKDLNPRNKNKFEINFRKQERILSFFIEKNYANNVVRKNKVKMILND